MSQLPVDLLGAAAPSAGRVNRVPQLYGRQGIGSLSAPGIQAAPPEVRSSNALETLAGALGILPNVAQTVADYLDERVQIVRGEAAQRATENLPKILAEIESGQIKAPANLDEIDSVAAAIVEQTLDTSQVSRAWADEYRRRLHPALVQALTDKHLADHRANDAAIIQTLRDGLNGETNSASIRRAVDAAMSSLYFKPTEDQAIAMVALPAAKLAAQQGSREAFEAAMEVIGDRFAFERQTLRTELDAAIERQRQEAARTDREYIRGLFIDNAPIETIEKAIHAKRESIGEESTTEFLNRLSAYKNRQIDAAQQATLGLIYNAIADGDLETAFTMIERGRVLPPDHGEHVRPETALALLDRIRRKQERDNSMIRVQARLRGEAAIITDQDDAAVEEALAAYSYIGPDGQRRPLIDEAGNVTNADLFAQLAQRLDYIPKSIINQIDAAAAGKNPDDMARAARLYWRLSTVADSALSKATGIREQSRIALRIMRDRLNLIDSKIGLSNRPDDDPVAMAHIREEAKRVLQFDVQAMAEADSTAALKLYTTAVTRSEAETKILDLIQSNLPKFAQERQRALMGIDIALPDATIDNEQLPPMFVSQFGRKAAQYYMGMIHGGWSDEQARAEASRLAIEELEHDFIYAVLNDRLWALPRRDVPKHIRWDASAEQQARFYLENLRANKLLDEDFDIEDWRPNTYAGARTLHFVRIDDPLKVLTDARGMPVAFLPTPPTELQRNPSLSPIAAQERRMMIDAVLREREIAPARNAMFFAIGEARSTGFDRLTGPSFRRDRLPDWITDGNLKWYYLVVERIPPSELERRLTGRWGKEAAKAIVAAEAQMPTNLPPTPTLPVLNSSNSNGNQ